MMLKNRFIGSPPGACDRILDFSTAETGCLFFTPSLDWLDDPTPVERAPGTNDALASTDPPAEHQSVDATGPITTPAIDTPGPPIPTDTEPAQGESSSGAAQTGDDIDYASRSGSLGISKVANEPY